MKTHSPSQFLSFGFELPPTVVLCVCGSTFRFHFLSFLSLFSAFTFNLLCQPELLYTDCRLQLHNGVELTSPVRVVQRKFARTGVSKAQKSNCLLMTMIMDGEGRAGACVSDSVSVNPTQASACWAKFCGEYFF